MYTLELEVPSPLPPTHGSRLQIAFDVAAAVGKSSYVRDWCNAVTIQFCGHVHFSVHNPIHGHESSNSVGIAASASTRDIVPRPALDRIAGKTPSLFNLDQGTTPL